MAQAVQAQKPQTPQIKAQSQLSENVSAIKKYILRGQNQHASKFFGFRLLAAFSSVLISELLIGQLLARKIFNSAFEKRFKASLLQPEAGEKAKWVNTQIRNFIKTSIRYSSIIFCSKILLDQHYAETLKRNQTYYQSNSSLHFKIGALVGLITYSTSIPISEFHALKNSSRRNQTNFSTAANPKPQNYFSRLSLTWSEFLSPESLKRMLNSFSLMSMTGIILYRTVYFGSYEKLKRKYDHPVNQYLLAPIGCSTLAMVVTPIDQIKFLQMTSHKGKSFVEIVSQKGIKLWNFPGQKISYSIVKQSFLMSMFVTCRSLCNYLIGLKTSSE